MTVCLLSTLLIDLVPPHPHLHPWTGQAWDQNSRLADKDMASALKNAIRFTKILVTIL